MTGVDLLPPAVLKRKAIGYVRQSTQAQVASDAGSITTQINQLSQSDL